MSKPPVSHDDLGTVPPEAVQRASQAEAARAPTNGGNVMRMVRDDALKAADELEKAGRADIASGVEKMRQAATMRGMHLAAIHDTGQGA